MIIEEKQIYIYGEREKKVPLVIVNTFQGDGRELFTGIREITENEITLAVISDINWDDEMSPWECPPLYKNDSPCTGGADGYLDKLTKKIIPAIKEESGNEAERVIITGYSLAGLFALYSLYRTDVFDAAVSASGSLWFPGFTGFTESNSFCRKPEKVYFSLGNKEAKTRNLLLSTVETGTREIYEKYKNLGIDTIFEMNPGNHFKDPDLRLAKGIAWVL